MDAAAISCEGRGWSLETSLFEDIPGIAFVNLATLYGDGFLTVPVNVVAGTVTLQRVATGF